MAVYFINVFFFYFILVFALFIDFAPDIYFILLVIDYFDGNGAISDLSLEQLSALFTHRKHWLPSIF